MNIFTFLTKLEQPQNSLEFDSMLWEFRGKEYPLLFFSMLIPKLRLNSIDRSSLSIETLSNLDMSFLNESARYWLGDSLLDKRNSEIFEQYFKTYSGNSKFAAFVIAATKQISKKALGINIDCAVGYAEYKYLYRFFFPSYSYDETIIKVIIQKNYKLSLELACQIVRYQALLGKQEPKGFMSWLEHLISPARPLFILSQHFFARDKVKFFNMWCKCKDYYPKEFWICYWLEQLWQAVVFLDELKRSKSIEYASNMVQKLPFSYMQHDYKKNSISQLTQAYHYLYTLDCLIKNGENRELELFYYKFF
ncbi:MAG TPA: hypothetical protein VHA52_08055 [Candidatus Babeliaceae bacterium]|nr:hypothetical protein [Candidatus Babeliaceae bacterium]